MATRLEKLTERMVDAADVSTDFYGMVYGDIGVGKTVWAAQLAQAITPTGKGILFCDTRRGFSVLRDYPELTAGMQLVKIESPDDLATLAQAIMSGAEPWVYVGTIILDEINVLAADTLTRIVRERTMVPDDQAVSAVPEWPDYNANQSIMAPAVSALTGIEGINVIAVSGDKMSIDNQKLEKHRADISPGLGKILMRDMHLVARMEAKVDKTAPDAPAQYTRELQVNPTVRIEAKTRISGLPVKVDADTLIDTIADWIADPSQVRADVLTGEVSDVPEDEPVLAEDGTPLPESDDEVYSAPMDE